MTDTKIDASEAAETEAPEAPATGDAAGTGSDAAPTSEPTSDDDTSDEGESDDGADAADNSDEDDSEDDTADDTAEVSPALRKARREAQKLRQRAKEAEAALARVTAAAEAGISPELAARLNGNTAEELQADAEKLRELLGTGKPRRGPGEPPRTGDHLSADFKTSRSNDPQDILQRIYHR